jgi:hypothetical protein
MGDKQNFVKNHNLGISKVCQLNIEKKKKASTYQQSQPGILSFFMKKPKDLIPLTISVLTPVIAYMMESKSTSQFSRSYMMANAPRTLLPAPNKHAINILVTLEKAVRNLPVLPDATESNEIAVFSGNVPTNLAKEDAWEYLDLMLNCFLGFNRIPEDIYNALQGGVMGLLGMVYYLKEFASQYQIDGALLEGKIQ